MFCIIMKVLIEDSNDVVLGNTTGGWTGYSGMKKDNDGNYHSNTSALEIFEKTETGYVLENIGKERKLFKSDGRVNSSREIGMDEELALVIMKKSISKKRKQTMKVVLNIFMMKALVILQRCRIIRADV